MAPGGTGFGMKVLRTAVRFAKWMGYLSLACGVLYSFGGLVVDLLTIGLNWGTVLAFGALVGMPVIFATFGFLLCALIGLIAQGVGAVLDRMGGGEAPEKRKVGAPTLARMNRKQHG